MSKLLHIIQGVEILQDEDDSKRIHFIADLSDDCDGSPHSYRLDNNSKLALDDIHDSAGYPHGDWQNVLVPDPLKPSQPYVDANGYCVSMTSYQRGGFPKLDRQRYLNAETVPYAVIPGLIRKRCRGVLLGCSARITDTTTGRSIACVTGDFSGYSIGEASDFAAKFFDKHLSPRNGDDRRIYLFEYFPDHAPLINGEQFELKPMNL